MTAKLEKIIKEMKENVKPSAEIHSAFICMTKLIECFYQHLKDTMDKQISKVKKDIDNGNKKKGEKDVKKLKVMDKAFDKKIAKAKSCEIKMKKK